MIARALVAGSTITAAAWALWPLGQNADATRPSEADRPSALASAASSASDTQTPHVQPLDQAAFRAPLWVSPPPPPPPPPAPAPLPPLKLQLLAILGDSVSSESRPSGYRAMLYDPERDTVLTVAAGDPLGGGRVVDRVDRTSVSIRESSRNGPGDRSASQPPVIRTLSLDSSASPGAGGVR